MKYGLWLLFLLGGSLSATSQWVALDSGLNDHVRVLLYDSLNARLYVFGHFTEAGEGSIVNGTTYYQDGEWHALGDGIESVAGNAVIGAAFQNDSVMVLGSFPSALGIPNTHRVALWNGEQWQSIGGIGANGAVWGILANEDGWTIGGNYTEIGGEQALRLARFRDGAWEGICSFPDTSAYAFYSSIVKYQDEYVIGGNISSLFGISELGILINDTLRAMGTGILGDAMVNDMKVYDEDLYVAGDFYSGAGNPGSGLIKWNGTEWSDPLPGVQYITQVHDLDVFDDKLFIGGRCILPGSSDYYTLAMYTPEQICLFGKNINAVMNAIAGAPEGLYMVPNVPSLIVDGVQLGRLALYDINQGFDTCIALPTSISDVFQKPVVLNVWLNSGGEIEVQMPGSIDHDHKLHLYDSQGRVVYVHGSKTAGAVLNFGSPQLPSGLYLGKLEDTRYSFKLMVGF